MSRRLHRIASTLETERIIGKRIERIVACASNVGQVFVGKWRGMQMPLNPGDTLVLEYDNWNRDIRVYSYTPDNSVYFTSDGGRSAQLVRGVQR